MPPFLVFFIAQWAVKKRMIENLTEKRWKPPKIYYIDFLIFFHFSYFLSEKSIKHHKIQRQLEENCSVDEFNFSIFHIYWVTVEKLPRVYGVSFKLPLCCVQSRCVWMVQCQKQMCTDYKSCVLLRLHFTYSRTEFQIVASTARNPLKF